MILLLRIGKESLNINCSLINIIPETITLPAPSLFDLTVGTYLVPLTAIHAYRNPAPPEEPEPEPQFDPSRQSVYQWDPEEIANQWQPEAPSQYDPNYNFGYLPGQPWQ